MTRSNASGALSATNASISSSKGGSPVRSNDARRMSAMRSASTAGINPFASIGASTKASISLRHHARSSTAGSAGFTNTVYAHHESRAALARAITISSVVETFGGAPASNTAAARLENARQITRREPRACMCSRYTPLEHCLAMNLSLLQKSMMQVGSRGGIIQRPCSRSVSCLLTSAQFRSSDETLLMHTRHIRALASLPSHTTLVWASMRNALLCARRSVPSLAAMSLIATTSTGCLAVGGSKHSESPTLGKQLLDLKTALDSGAVTEQEYAAEKAKLLHQPAPPAPTV